MQALKNVEFGLIFPIIPSFIEHFSKRVEDDLRSKFFENRRYSPNIGDFIRYRAQINA